MHAHVPEVDLKEEYKADALRFSPAVYNFFIFSVIVGLISLALGFSSLPAGRVWSSYYISLIFFMGLSLGGVVISFIFQIVRATWSRSLRRLAEANVAFFPIAFVGVMVTWVGRKSLFPWAVAPRAGSELWMQPAFVFARNGVLLGSLFIILWYCVSLIIRLDRGAIAEATGVELPTGWRGSEVEVKGIQNFLSTIAPAVLVFYGLAVSFFAFEMVMAQDKAWVSNLLGAYYFVGNVYMGWAVLAILSTYFSAKEPSFGKLIDEQVRWDLGKLTFGFCMLWGYFSLSQFLPQWYGNLPEESQWLIHRTREYPWKGFFYLTFGCAFVFPFITLLSREVKKTPNLLSTVACVILFGVWSEKFLFIMPHASADTVPLGLVDVGIFLGFLGLYGISLNRFLSRVPRIAVGHPLTVGSTKW